MPTPDIYSLLMGSEPDAAASAQAMAEQIRRGRQGALAGALGAPNAIGVMGQQVAANAKQDQGTLEKSLEQRARYGEEAANRNSMLKIAQIQAKGALDLEKARILAAAKQQDDYKQEAMANEKIRIALDPNGPRAGNFGNYSKRVAVLGDVQRLLDQAGDNPTESQTYEIARAFDTAISMGAATVSGTEHLVPHSLVGDAQKFQNWITNNYAGPNRAVWAQMMRDQVNSQSGYWKDKVGETVRERLGSLSPHFQKFPDSTAITLQQMGIDPATLPFHPLGKAAGSGAPAGGDKVTVTNGKETYKIPRAKLPEAVKDGFQEVKK